MKVIELLNKIAKGEDIPNKIKFDGDIFVYNQAFKDYEYPDKCGWLMDISRGSGNEFLNDEVEIIEENKKINYVSTYVLCDSDFKTKGEYSLTAVEIIDKAFEEYSDAINELIEIVNKLKNKE